MSTIRMRSGAQMTFDISPDDLEQLLKDNDLLIPVEAGFSAPYATDVEYGTGPGTVTSQKDIEAWARRKKDDLKGIELDSEEKIVTFARSVVANHLRRGQLPNPYFAPAVEEVRMNMRRYKDDFAKEGMYVIANAIISQAQKNIEDRGITDQGGLVNSAFVRRSRE